MLRTLKGLVLGLIAQGAAHALLTWPLGAHIFPPNAWHLIPFIIGGLACGRYASSAWPGLFVGLPYAALVILADIAVGPSLSVSAVGLAIAGLALGTITCGLVARRRRVAELATTPPQDSGTPKADGGAPAAGVGC